ncbi:calcium uniporter protein 2, mitochondrial-like [Andrographis paniculata]|uniref:calcium uniporter protein 2, mitochondrial-like n=1 Tax=Andrographis paniculata TaxID=175694 RepID=UPI0021E948E2|nr:calcium uniporter protein 2, mitochondrial-like [Andrographis paniculata]
MALLRKSLAHRLNTMSRINSRTLTNCRTSSPRTVVGSAALNHVRAPDPGDEGILRRFLHRGQSPAAVNPAALGFVPTGEKLLEKLREMDGERNRRLNPPAAAEASMAGKVTVADAKKILRLSQLEKVKSNLRQMKKDSITYLEFMEICVNECSSVDQGLEFATTLDESGTVIVLGNVVFLRPEQVVKVIEGLIPVSSPSVDDPRIKEFQELDKQKATIDRTAEASVKRELRFGLAYLVVQTAAFMRLTFWELTWDVMEPVCFFVTSVYLMGAFGFFLRTAKEPSFEGYFQTRFSAKQGRLFKVKRFDLERYNELKKACCSQSQRSEH